MEDISMRIRDARKRLGLTQGQFAELVGVTQSTVSRWERGSGVEFEHLQAIAAALGQSVDDFSGRNSPKRVKIESVTVQGSVAAGIWMEALEWSVEACYDVYWKPVKEYEGMKTFGLEVIGPSMDKIYPEGSTLICVRLSEIRRPIRNEERVIVYQKRRDGKLEATVKEYIKDQATGEVWLWPRSNHPLHQTPLKYPSTPDDVEEVVIHAVVIGSFRPE